MSLVVGQILANRFKIIHPLGSESSPSIFKVLDTQTNTNLAIKVLAYPNSDPIKADELKYKVRQVSDLVKGNQFILG